MTCANEPRFPSESNSARVPARNVVRSLVWREPAIEVRPRLPPSQPSAQTLATRRSTKLQLLIGPANLPDRNTNESANGKTAIAAQSGGEATPQLRAALTGTRSEEGVVTTVVKTRQRQPPYAAIAKHYRAKVTFTPT